MRNLTDKPIKVTSKVDHQAQTVLPCAQVNFNVKFSDYINAQGKRPLKFLVKIEFDGESEPIKANINARDHDESHKVF